MKTTKRERFVRIAEQRTQKVLDGLKALAKCAAPASYEYGERDAEQICAAIESGLQGVREAFAGRKRFSLSTDVEQRRADVGERDRMIALMKEVRFPPFPGGGLDVNVADQLPDHAFEAVVEHLMANGIGFVGPDITG